MQPSAIDISMVCLSVSICILLGPLAIFPFSPHSDSADHVHITNDFIILLCILLCLHVSGLMPSVL